MTVEVLPFTGVRIDGTLLEFGMTASEVRAVAQGIGEWRMYYERQCMAPSYRDFKRRDIASAHDAWLSGLLYSADWDCYLRRNGLVIEFAGGAKGEPSGRLARIAARTWPTFEDDPDEGVPPVLEWDGVDLLGESWSDVRTRLPGDVVASNDRESQRWRMPGERWESLGLRVHLCGVTALGAEWYDPAYGAWEQCCTGTFTCAAGGDYGFLGRSHVGS